MVGVTKIGPRTANYWINAVAEGGEDYYTKPGEVPGEWMGELADELGLSGQVEPDAYAAILAGEHPGTAEALVERPPVRRFVDREGRERRLDPILGYDVRFSAPKSVSLLYAVGSPEVRSAILSAHEDAVRQAIGYLERHACFVQRGKGGERIEEGIGFVAMAFRHRSSRAGDPALHTHVVTSNMTRARSDGRWLSLAAPKGRMPLWTEAKAAGYAYQAALRAALTRELGLVWQEPHNGYADLEGIGREVIEHFSRRRAEIVAAMAERGVESAAAAEVAAYRTRDAKDYGVDPDRRRAEWVSRAAEFGLSAASIAAMVEQAQVREPQAIEADDLQLALTDLEERHSHFDRRELLAALAGRLCEGADTETLEAAVDSLLATSRVKEIYRGPELLSPTYYTTPRIWELEQGFIERARRGVDAEVAVVDSATLGAVLERHRYLSAEQVKMVSRLTIGGERVLGVAALPGSGKTTALGVAREAWAAAGIRGIGLATARSASGQLGEAADMPATSITDFLIRIERRIERGLEPLPPGTVIVVDEASTAPTPYLAVLAELAERCGGKLVMIGDTRQIGAVGPGGLFGHLTSEVAPIQLTEIRRQHDPLDRHIVGLAHEGRGSDALDVLAMKERFVVADTLPEALDAQALDWRSRFVAGEDAVMIARRNRDVAALNERARELLAREGRLGERALVVGGRPFAVGDRVITRVNTAKVSNRERWDVVGVDARRERLRLRRLDERSGVVLDRRYLDRTTEAGEPALQHAYALTTYATQSKTFDSAFALLDSGISSEDFTVAISRARGPVIAYAAAAGELTDSDLGPETPETDDPIYDLRLGAERTAAEYAASEIALWGEVMQRAPVDLALRRAELEGRHEEQGKPTPAEKRLERLKERIRELEAKVAGLASEQEELRGKTGLGSERTSRIETGARIAARQLRRMEGEREDLNVEVSAQLMPVPPTGIERAELSMIEDRMKYLHRRQVAAERIQPSRIVEESLGARPEDPEAAALWGEGVDAIHAFRQRYGITTTKGHPLGPDLGDTTRRAERRGAEVRLEQVRARLGRQRVRDADRELGLYR